MDRRDFLEKIGIGAAFALTSGCLASCTKTTLAVDFSLNLDDAANVALKTNGGYVIKNGVVIARDTSGNYAAATVVCSHQQQSEVVYNKTTNEWLCNAHGARFDLAGKGLNNNGNGGLTVYQTAVSGTSLRIFS